MLGKGQEEMSGGRGKKNNSQSNEAR